MTKHEFLHSSVHLLLPYAAITVLKHTTWSSMTDSDVTSGYIQFLTNTTDYKCTLTGAKQNCQEFLEELDSGRRFGSCSFHLSKDRIVRRWWR